MRVYNLEIFDIERDNMVVPDFHKYKNVFHHKIGDVTHSSDYFSKTTNFIELPINKSVKRRQVVRITDALDMEVEFIGMVTAVEYEQSMMKVTYESFVSAFLDLQMVFDTNLQHNQTTSIYTSLEKYLAEKARYFAGCQGWESEDWATQVHVSNVTDDVTFWGFNIKPDNEGTHYAAINFKDVLINRSASELDVWVRESFGPQIVLRIGKADEDTKTIETNAPFVIDRTVRFETTRDGATAIGIYNAANGDFLDFGDYSTVEGAVYTEAIVTVPEDETFANVAQAEANQRLASEKVNNYIEIEVPLDTSDFIKWQVGQKVNVIHEGSSIASVLTGKKIDKTLTLIFGTIRLELTKRLRRS